MDLVLPGLVKYNGSMFHLLIRFTLRLTGFSFIFFSLVFVQIPYLDLPASAFLEKTVFNDLTSGVFLGLDYTIQYCI